MSNTEQRPNIEAMSTADPSLVGWWVCTDFLWRNGRRVMGPFVDQELALNVRTLMEKVEGHHNYFVDEISAADAPEPLG